MVYRQRVQHDLSCWFLYDSTYNNKNWTKPGEILSVKFDMINLQINKKQTEQGKRTEELINKRTHFC